MIRGMKRKKKTSRKPQRTRGRPTPQTLEQFLALSDAAQDEWNRAEHAINKMRTEGWTAPRAAQEYNLSARKLIRLGRAALRKGKNGRYVAKPHDRLLRVITVSTREGLGEIATRDSREASIAGRHSAAVERYLQTGDYSGLRKLPRKYITDANGKRVKLLTKLEEIERLGNAGSLSFQSMYARSA